MATQMGMTGRIGNMVHYKMGDKFYTRSLPRKYKQTKANKSEIFGIRNGVNHCHAHSTKSGGCYF